ncbi:hypothetical protein [Streptacidiphilus sp. EB103A]|uniref:hypothetical protein n=1 Tax=Streptacidiphilus sp. EB103A TaxID=3156275 RepID=UPI00351145BE
MSLASKLLSVLDEFRTVIASQVNSGQLVTIDGHIDAVAAHVETDVAAADTKAKEVLGALYDALHGDGAPDAPATPVDATPAPVADPAPVLQEPAPVEAAAAPVEAAVSETPAS